MFAEVFMVAVRVLRGLPSYFCSFLCSLPDDCNNSGTFTKMPVRELCFAQVSVLLVLTLTLQCLTSSYTAYSTSVVLYRRNHFPVFEQWNLCMQLMSFSKTDKLTHVGILHIMCFMLQTCIHPKNIIATIADILCTSHMQNKGESPFKIYFLLHCELGMGILLLCPLFNLEMWMVKPVCFYKQNMLESQSGSNHEKAMVTA